mgnify:CR=1 FL=1
MSGFSLSKNKQGYYDETAYKAIKAVEETMEKVNSGEIWQMQKANGESQEAYIVKAFDNVSVILMLSEDVRNPGEIQVQSRAQMWADPRRIRFTYNSNFTDFIKKVPDDEVEKINTMTRYTLFGAVSVHTKSADWKAEEELDSLRKQVDSLEGELDSCHELISEQENENIKYQAQVEMTGGLYRELLDRVAGK